MTTVLSSSCPRKSPSNQPQTRTMMPPVPAVFSGMLHFPFWKGTRNVLLPQLSEWSHSGKSLVITALTIFFRPQPRQQSTCLESLCHNSNHFRRSSFSYPSRLSMPPGKLLPHHSLLSDNLYWILREIECSLVFRRNSFTYRSFTRTTPEPTTNFITKANQQTSATFP